MAHRKRRKKRRTRIPVKNVLSSGNPTARELTLDALKMHEAEGSTSGDLDNLLLQAFKNKIEFLANNVKPEVAIGLLASEVIRKQNNISIEMVAYSLEVSSDTYKLFIKALENRVSSDPLLKDALEL